MFYSTWRACVTRCLDICGKKNVTALLTCIHVLPVYVQFFYSIHSALCIGTVVLLLFVCLPPSLIQTGNIVPYYSALSSTLFPYGGRKEGWYSAVCLISRCFLCGRLVIPSVMTFCYYSYSIYNLTTPYLIPLPVPFFLYYCCEEKEGSAGRLLVDSEGCVPS